MADSEKFAGSINTESCVDLVQFYIQSSAIVRIFVQSGSDSGNIWLANGRVVHAIHNTAVGINAFYEIIAWEKGTFSTFLNEKAPEDSINEPWSSIILKFYVRMDEKKAERNSLVEINQDRFSHPIIDTNELDFSDLNSVPPPKPLVKKTNKYEDAVKILFELDGCIAVSIVDLNSGMALASRKQDQKLNIDSYNAYMCELVKSNVKFLNKLKINEKIEDIIINLDKKFHIITFISVHDHTFIYMILDKDLGNLAIARLILEETVDTLSVR